MFPETAGVFTFARSKASGVERRDGRLRIRMAAQVAHPRSPVCFPIASSESDQDLWSLGEAIVPNSA